MKTLTRITTADPEATALLVEYPMLGTALLRLLDRKEMERFVSPQATITLQSRREWLFADGHDCRAAHTLYDVHLTPAGVRTIENGPCPFSGDFIRWWKRYMPSTERLGEITIGNEAL